MEYIALVVALIYVIGYEIYNSRLKRGEKGQTLKGTSARKLYPYYIVKP